MPDSVDVSQFKEEEEEKEKEKVEWMGIEVKSLTSELRKECNISKEAQGVVVLDVAPIGKLARAGLTRGDLIRGINRQKISNIKDFKEITKRAKLSQGVIFDILRGGRPLYITFIDER